jgi:hypothetical protein
MGFLLNERDIHPIPIERNTKGPAGEDGHLRRRRQNNQGHLRNMDGIGRNEGEAPEGM